MDQPISPRRPTGARDADKSPRDPPASPRRPTGAHDVEAAKVGDGGIDDDEPVPDWVADCEKCTRGFYMNILNETTERLQVLDVQLSSGKWNVPVPEYIESGAVLHVGSMSSGWMSGTEGSLSMLGGHAKLSWSNGYWSTATFEALMTRTGLHKYVLRHRQTVEETAGGYLLFVQVALSNITPEQLDVLRKAEAESQLSVIDKISESYESLVHAFIRPPRHIYTLGELGAPRFFLEAPQDEDGPLDPDAETRGFLCYRDDFEIKNRWNQLLKCSWYAREDLRDKPHPCVVYLHANSGSRVNAKQAVKALLPMGISVVAFDFSGSGLSDGELVTLGSRERRDVASVLAHVRASARTTRIGLWGRSMGAVAAILHTRIDGKVAALVCDSPFADLPLLCEEIVTLERRKGSQQQHRKPSRMPSFLVRGALMVVSSSIESRCDLNIYDVTPIKDVPCMTTPAMFVHGALDEMVDEHHSKDLYEAYGTTDKRYLSIEDQGHNNSRPPHVTAAIASFLCVRLLGAASAPTATLQDGGGVPFTPQNKRLSMNVSFAGFGWTGDAREGSDNGDSDAEDTPPTPLKPTSK